MTERAPALPRPRLLVLAWPLMAELVLGFGVGLLGLWLASRESAQTSGVYFAAGDVHAELGQRLQQARAKVLNQKPARVQE